MSPTNMVAGQGRRHIPLVADPLIGRTLGGRYLIQRYLMSGERGRVYAATDLVFRRPRALKVVLDAEPSAVAAMRREARLTSRLRHRGIVRVDDWGEDEGTAYFAMELLHGEVIEQRVSGGPLAPWRAASVAREIAQALAVVHDAGFVHRDVRPWNIFISLDDIGCERATLLDFGCLLARESEERHVRVHDPAPQERPNDGWPREWSERAESLSFDPRHDIYCLGVNLFAMLAPAVSLFDRWDSVWWFHEGLNEPALDHAQHLRGIVARCLMAPGHRYQRALDLADALAPHCRPD